MMIGTVLMTVHCHLVPMPGLALGRGVAERGLPSALSPRCPWAAVADDPARVVAAPIQRASTGLSSALHNNTAEVMRGRTGFSSFRPCGRRAFEGA